MIRSGGKAASAGKDARNVTFKERVGMPPYQVMYGEKRDVSRFQSIRLQSLGIFRQARKRKHTPRAKVAIFVGFGGNMSAFAIWIPEANII